MFKTTRLCAILLSLILLAGCAPAPSGNPNSITLFAMDTVMELTLYGPDAEAAGEQAADRIRELEGLLSVTDEGSDVFRINHSGGEPVTVSEDTAHVLNAALRLGEETGGALDISIYPVVKAWGFTTDSYQIPDRETLDELLEQVDYTAIGFDPKHRTVTLPAGMELDLGSIAKGYTGDQVVALFREAGVTSAILSLGGNVQTLGAKPDGSPWRVAVKDPGGSGYAGVLEVVGQAVVTSGGYERYFEADGKVYWHILDPATGSPARTGVQSVTVVGASGMVCDALSTALFLLGPEQAEDFWRAHDDFDYLLLTEDGEIILTQGLEDSFTPDETWADHTLTVVRR